MDRTRLDGDGRRETFGQERIHPVLGVVSQEDANVRLQRLIDLAEQQIPQGEAVALIPTVTTTQTEIVATPWPYFSVHVINDAASAAELWVNYNAGRPHEIRAGEDLEIRFGAAVIRRFFLRLQSGSGQLRVNCVY